MIAFLRDNKSYSLWESSFSEIDYAEAEKDIKLIRNIRNGVMHNKEISTQEFDANKKLIRKSNRGLDKAIEYVKSEHSREVRPNEVIISLQMTLENIGAKYAVSIKPMRDLVIAISESISKINNSNDLDIEQLLQKNITSNITITIPTLPSLYENNGCMDSIREMQNFHQRNIGLIPKINNPELIVMDSPELPAEPLTDEEAEDGNSEEDGNLENDENNDSNG